MRQTTISVLLLISFFAKAQVIAPPSVLGKNTIIGNVIRDEKLVAEFYYYFEHPSIEKSNPIKYDTTYAIRFKNYKYPDGNNFSTVEFNQGQGKKDSIFDALKNMFKNENKDNSSYSVLFLLNYGDTIQIRPYKSDSLHFCELDAKNSYIRLTETEVDDLFHKFSSSTEAPTYNTSPVFTAILSDAKFFGNHSTWAEYLQKNLDVDVPIRKGAPIGSYKVIVKFIVDTDGSIVEATPTTHFGYGMEDEALRVINNSPKWIPAKSQDGKPLKSIRFQPITFVVGKQ